MRRLALIFLISIMTASPTIARESDLGNLSGMEITLDSEKKLTIDFIKPGSIADRAGLRTMDKIIFIDNSSFYSDPSCVMTSIDGALLAQKSILLEVDRAGDRKLVWLRQEKLDFHHKKALGVYNETKTEWDEIKKEWQDFPDYLNLIRLNQITPEEFQKNTLKKADHLQFLRSRMIAEDRKTMQSFSQFEREISRVKDIACHAIFTMDETMQRAASYSKNNRIGEHFNKLEQRKKDISKQISAVELHLFKARQAVDL